MIVIKQLLDIFDSEDGWLNVIKVLQNNENQKKKPHFVIFVTKDLQLKIMSKYILKRVVKIDVILFVC